MKGASRSAIKNKIMLNTDDRLNEGLFPFMSVKDNLTMAVLQGITRKGNGLINRRKENEIVKKYTE